MIYTERDFEIIRMFRSLQQESKDSTSYIRSYLEPLLFRVPKQDYDLLRYQTLGMAHLAHYEPIMRIYKERFIDGQRADTSKRGLSEITRGDVNRTAGGPRSRNRKGDLGRNSSEKRY